MQLPPKLFLSALVANTANGADYLRQLSSTIDLAKKADRLKLQYQQGDITETERDRSRSRTLQNLMELLQDRRQQHIERFLFNEQTLNRAAEVEQGLEQLKLNTESATNDQSGQTTLICQLQLAGAKSQENVILPAIDPMRQVIAEREASIRSLTAKYKQIEWFEVDRFNNELLIKSLRRSLLEDLALFDRRRARIHGFLQSTLRPLQLDVERQAKGLAGFVHQQMAALSRVRHCGTPIAEASKHFGPGNLSDSAELSSTQLSSVAAAAEPHLSRLLAACGVG